MKVRKDILRNISQFIRHIQENDHAKAEETIREAIAGHVQIKYDEIYNRIAAK